MPFTRRQKNEQKYYNTLVQDKWRDKDLYVSKEAPSFASYSSDLFDQAKIYLGELANKKVLELACGSGEISVWLAKQGAIVQGIDISDKSIALAQKRALENQEQVNFQISSAEKTPFKNNTFDIVFINVSLHHLEIGPALQEIKRVLKPGGFFIAVEPFTPSPLIEKIRSSSLFQVFFPVRRETPDERILEPRDLKMIQHYFNFVESRTFRLFSSFVFKTKPLFHFFSFLYPGKLDFETKKRKTNSFFQTMDSFVLYSLPFTRLFSRYLVFRAQKEKD